jgi:hypothetical protein
MSTDPTKLRTPSFRLLLDEGMRLTRRNFTRIYPAVAIPLAAVAGVQSTVQIFYMTRMMQAPESGEEVFGSFITMWLAMMGLMLVLSVVYAAAASALVAAACDAATGETIDMARRWRWGWRPRVLGTVVLLGLVTGLGMMCCVVPGVLLGIAFGFTLPAMVLEGRFGTDAFSRSYQLVRHNPGNRLMTHPGLRVFVIGLVAALLSYAVTLVVQLPFVIVQQVGIVRSTMAQAQEQGDVVSFASGWMWLQVPQTILGQLANTAVWLYAAFVLVLLFDQLRRRMEGGDLEAVLDGLGAPPATGEEL